MASLLFLAVDPVVSIDDGERGRRSNATGNA